MPASPLRLVKNATEFCEISMVSDIPPLTRGIYVLYKYRPRIDQYDVVYVGMARGEKSGMKGRIKSHIRTKEGEWTHFSCFEVWDNVRENEIEELEGIFRHIYRHDSKANRLNVQRSYKPLNRIKSSYFDDWS